MIKVLQVNQHLQENQKLKRYLWLVFLEHEITTSKFTPICIWNDYEDMSTGVVVFLLHNDTNSLVMHQEQGVFHTLLHDDCKHDAYPTDDELFCANSATTIIKHSNLGASGSPFMYQYRNRWYLAGVIQKQAAVHDFHAFCDTTDYNYWFMNRPAPVPVLRSTCQEFQYGEENGKNVAFLELFVQRSQIYGFNVTLEFYLAKRDLATIPPIEITLQSIEDDLIEKILTRRPIAYLVTFPSKAFVIRHIYFSGVLVCENLDGE